MRWSSKSFGSSFKYGVFRSLIRLDLVPIARRMAFPISLYYALRPSVRKRASWYIERRFPGSSKREMLVHTFRLYRNFANVLFDRLIAGSGLALKIVHDKKAVELFKDVFAQGRGCIMVGAHFGCWQTGLLGLRSLGQPMGVVFWQEEKIEHSYFRYDREVSVINANGGIESVIGMRNILKRNGILCMMGDRMTPGDRNSAIVSFMGGKIEIPTFPYLLSERTGAPVIHAASIRSQGVIQGLPAVLNPGGEKAPGAFVAFLEELVERYPHEFFNFYDMWQGTNDKDRTDV